MIQKKWDVNHQHLLDFGRFLGFDFWDSPKIIMEKTILSHARFMALCLHGFTMVNTKLLKVDHHRSTLWQFNIAMDAFIDDI
jgi:hypothetical protein